MKMEWDILCRSIPMCFIFRSTGPASSDSLGMGHPTTGVPFSLFHLVSVFLRFSEDMPVVTDTTHCGVRRGFESRHRHFRASKHAQQE